MSQLKLTEEGIFPTGLTQGQVIGRVVEGVPSYLYFVWYNHDRGDFSGIRVRAHSNEEFTIWAEELEREDYVLFQSWTAARETAGIQA